MASTASAQPKPASPTAQATLLGQFGDWGAYTANARRQQGLLCVGQAKLVGRFASESPHCRQSVYMFVSTRPSENVKDEISMLVTGYVLKPNTEATVGVGTANFAMYTQKRRCLGEKRSRGIATRRCHAQGPGCCDQGHHEPRHQDHRYIFAQGAFPGARGWARSANLKASSRRLAATWQRRPSIGVIWRVLATRFERARRLAYERNPSFRDREDPARTLYTARQAFAGGADAGRPGRRLGCDRGCANPAKMRCAAALALALRTRVRRASIRCPACRRNCRRGSMTTTH